MKHSEKEFIAKALVTNVYPQVKVRDLHIEPYKLLPNGYAQVKVSANIYSNAFFRETIVSYERFKLSDFKTKITDQTFDVPHTRAVDPQALVNYMNEVYLQSVTVRQKFSGDSIFRSFQTTLKPSDLKPFVLSQPTVDDTLLIEAVPESYLYSGLLRIKFV